MTKRMHEPRSTVLEVSGPNEMSLSHRIGRYVRSGPALARWSFAGGLLVVAVLFWRIGLHPIGNALSQAQWMLPLVFVPYTLVIFCETLGWRFAFPPHHAGLSITALMRVTVGAKAIQLVTPSIVQAGEVMKIHLLRSGGARLDVAAASVVLAKTTTTLAELIFVGLGLIGSLGTMELDPAVAMSLSFGIAAAGGGVLGLLMWQRIGLFRPLLWMSRRIAPLALFVHRHGDVLASTERLVREGFADRRRFGQSCGWFFLGWAGGIVETWIFLTILGLPDGLHAAVVVQVWSVIITRFSTFIPGNVGAQEAGAVMVFATLGLSPEAAMAFAILRRIRQIGWIGGGFGVLARATP